MWPMAASPWAEYPSAPRQATNPMAAARRYPGKVDQLPARLQTLISKLLAAGCTQREITEKLNALLAEQGGSVSKSSVNRYITRMRANGQRMREVHEAAQAWSKTVGTLDGGEVDNYLMEMLRILAVKSADQLGNETDPDLKAISDLALTARRLVHAQESVDKRIEAIRKRTVAEAAEAAAEAARADGVKAETIAQIRARVMGI